MQSQQTLRKELLLLRTASCVLGGDQSQREMGTAKMRLSRILAILWSVALIWESAIACMDLCALVPSDAIVASHLPLLIWAITTALGELHSACVTPCW